MARTTLYNNFSLYDIWMADQEGTPAEPIVTGELKRTSTPRKEALRDLRFESNKEVDRIAKAKGERIKLMRSTKERRAEKRTEAKEKDVSPRERMRRINLLLRSGMYDKHRMQRLLNRSGDKVKVEITVDPQGKNGPDETKSEEISKAELKQWFDSLLPHEKQRLYVLGRKKVDFKITWEDYVSSLEKNEDPEKNEKPTQEGFKDYKDFQEGQKELADALEIVALPMLRGVFEDMGIKTNIYLTAANDDIAGGLDVAIEFQNVDGSPNYFSDGKPMRLVIDMTYARMWDKAKIELRNGRLSQEAYDILKGDDDFMDSRLSNARAMKLFRTVTETLGGKMSTQTYDQNGPMLKPQDHIPRLIGGLEWENAFAQISQWVAKDDYKDWFKTTTFAKRLAASIKNQVQGLYDLTELFGGNDNTQYLKDLMNKLGIVEGEVGAGGYDKALENIDRILIYDEDLFKDASPEQQARYEERKAEYKEMNRRFYDAALVQLEHGPIRNRGDIPDAKPQDQEGVQENQATLERKRELRAKIEELKATLKNELAELEQLLEQKK